MQDQTFLQLSTPFPKDKTFELVRLRCKVVILRNSIMMIFIIIIIIITNVIYIIPIVSIIINSFRMKIT